MATLTFNGLSLDEDPYHIVTIEGLLDSPEIRSGNLTRVGRSGLVAGRDLYGGRTITLTIDLVGDDLDDFGDAVSALSRAFVAPQDDEIPLVFTIPGVADGNAARLNVKVNKRFLPMPSSYHNGTGRADIQLVATDPLLYSEAETSVSVTLAVPAGGRPYDRVYPMLYGAGGTYGSVTVTNEGAITAPVTLRINGPVTNPQVVNVTTGQTLGFTTVLGVGDFLDIDTVARTVLLGGTADRYSTLTTPQWWGLVPGVNEIRYLASVSTASTVSLTFRSAWI